MVYKNKYIPINVIKINSLDYNNFSPIIIRLIIINTKNNNILRDNKVGIS